MRREGTRGRHDVPRVGAQARLVVVEDRRVTATRPPWVDSFYGAGSTDIVAICGTLGSAGRVVLRLRRPRRVSPRGMDASFRSRLIEVAASTRTLTGGGYRFEVAEVNRDLEGAGTLWVSTFRSSITGNAGNVAELAGRNERRRVLYVSSVGQGRTSGFTRSERRRVVRTGSLVRDERGRVDPLPIVAALGECLRAEGFAVGSLRSDSSGRLLSTAVGVMLPRDTLASVYLNAPPNLTQLGGLSFLRAFAAEDGRLRRQMRDSPDPEKVDAALESQVARALPRHFVASADRWVELRTLVVNARALSRPAPDLLSSPVVRDLDALLAEQRLARVGLVIGGSDPLGAGVTDSDLWVLGQHVSRLTRGRVCAVVLPGAHHGAHAAYPAFYAALEQELIGSD